jgi:membrane-associated phospholipid phosphatase
MVLSAAFFVLTRFVRRNPTIPRELSLDQALTARAPAGLIGLSQAINVQNWVFVALALVVCLLVLRRFRQALLLLLAVPFAEALNLALKILIDRQFPGSNQTLSLAQLDNLLFPSGHVVRTTVTLGVFVAFVTWSNPRLRVPATLGALGFIGLVGFTQTTVGGHLPLDCVGGFLLGAAIVNVFWVADQAWANHGLGHLPKPTRPRIIVIEWHPNERALARVLPKVAPVTVARGWVRPLPAAGVVVVLLSLALMVGGSQHLSRLAPGPGSATPWPRLMSDAAQHADAVIHRLARIGGGA